MKISVHLHKNRHVPGILQIITPAPLDAPNVQVVSDGKASADVTGNHYETFRCLALSDQAAANAHNNPTRDPLHHEGDLPTGEFLAVRTNAALPATPENIRSFGSGIRFVLNPVSGPASEAVLNGRYGLMIHGGATGAPMPAGALRPTRGCLRVDDSTIAYLATLTPSFPITVMEDLKDL